MPQDQPDFRTRLRIEAVVAIMVEYRKLRLRYMMDIEGGPGTKDEMPACLTREAEAEAILRELNLA